MNHFLLSTEQRLNHWKNFRNSLIELPEIEILDEVAKYWSVAPLTNIAYDCDSSKHWPTIWEMISNNNWCRNSIAIGMEATLRMAGIDSSRTQLGIILDDDISMAIMVLKIDSDYVLNYNYGSVVAYPKTKHRWLKKFRWDGRKYLEF